MSAHPDGRCRDQLCPGCYTVADDSPEPGQMDTLLGVPPVVVNDPPPQRGQKPA